VREASKRELFGRANFGFTFWTVPIAVLIESHESAEAGHTMRHPSLAPLSRKRYPDSAEWAPCDFVYLEWEETRWKRRCTSWMSNSNYSVRSTLGKSRIGLPYGKSGTPDDF
jgi:hypothetical protein